MNDIISSHQIVNGLSEIVLEMVLSFIIILEITSLKGKMVVDANSTVKRTISKCDMLGDIEIQAIGIMKE